jgi:hypothetical protein
LAVLTVDRPLLSFLSQVLPSFLHSPVPRGLSDGLRRIRCFAASYFQTGHLDASVIRRLSYRLFRRKATLGSSRPWRISMLVSAFVFKMGNIACSPTRTALSSRSRPLSASSTPSSPSSYVAPRSTSPSALCRSLCMHDVVRADCLSRDDNATAIFVDDDTRIQILDSMPDLPRADKEQCGAFIVKLWPRGIFPICLYDPTARRTSAGCLVRRPGWHYPTVP